MKAFGQEKPEPSRLDPNTLGWLQAVLPARHTHTSVRGAWGKRTSRLHVSNNFQEMFMNAMSNPDMAAAYASMMRNNSGVQLNMARRKQLMPLGAYVDRGVLVANRLMCSCPREWQGLFLFLRACFGRSILDFGRRTFGLDHSRCFICCGFGFCLWFAFGLGLRHGHVIALGGPPTTGSNLMARRRTRPSAGNARMQRRPGRR